MFAPNTFSHNSWRDLKEKTDVIQKPAFSKQSFSRLLETVRDGTIGVLVDLRLGEAHTLNFGAGRLPEERWTQNTISFLKQEACVGVTRQLPQERKTSQKTPKIFLTLTACLSPSS